MSLLKLMRRPDLVRAGLRPPATARTAAAATAYRPPRPALAPGLAPHRPVPMRSAHWAATSGPGAARGAGQVRALSFGTVPRMMARAFKVPLYGAGIGAGALGYAQYKLEGGRCSPSSTCLAAPR